MGQRSLVEKKAEKKIRSSLSDGTSCQSQAGKCLPVLSESDGNKCYIRVKKPSENCCIPTAFLGIDCRNRRNPQRYEITAKIAHQKQSHEIFKYVSKNSSYRFYLHSTLDVTSNP